MVELMTPERVCSCRPTSMESTENRFAHLLQPIRELTKNWDVDVASELNDYLEELDEMCITFDGGNIRLNFAEAALLIQGSACIYSKKVELLHSLVYQTLEYINDKHKKRDKRSAAEDDGLGPVDRCEADDATLCPPDLDISEDSQWTDADTTATVTPLPPESLIPSESREIKLPLISENGEVLYSQKDFRINAFLPGDKGMIVLRLGPASSRLLLDGPPSGRPGRTRGAEPQRRRRSAVTETREDDMGDNAGERVDRQKAQDDGRTVRERRRLEDEVNPWALHDPYAALGEEKPRRPGKCYKVPEGLDDGGKRKRKRGAPLQDFRTWFRGSFDPTEPKLKNGPTFTDLNGVYLSSMKARLASRKAGVAVSDEELRRTFLQLEEAGLQQGEESVEAFRDHDLMGVHDDGSDSGHEDVPADFLGPDVQGAELSYEHLVKLRVEQLVTSSRGYTQETALSQRVRDWGDQIQPELVLQEARPLFDIHAYGDRIVGALQSVGRRRRFSSIAAGLDRLEVCRYLLASLQLANDSTVGVDSAGVLEDGLDSMGLTLLSTQRATDRFQTLTAAS
ncbi:condensin-2 complex subunit H2 [Brachionichthys hirsutus]|uniref:condensin-2 complex subunit H2 n=1 Tax=Brachionichthys hirsutus TaxID=412623 RepID=UPI003605479F